MDVHTKVSQKLKSDLRVKVERTRAKSVLTQGLLLRACLAEVVPGMRSGSRYRHATTFRMILLRTRKCATQCVPCPAFKRVMMGFARELLFPSDQEIQYA